jgi:nitroreductase
MTESTPSPDALLALLRARRSIRRFQPEPVPEDAIARMAEAASWAPSARNRQAFRLVAVTSSERIRAMAQAVEEESGKLRAAFGNRVPGAYLDNFLHFAGAPLVFVPFHRAGLDPLRAMGVDHPVAGQVEADALSSVSAAIQNLLLCAQALGLGACWMTGPLVAAEALAQLLEVPNGWRLSALIPVGFPAEAPATPRRRSVEQMLRRLT